MRRNPIRPHRDWLINKASYGKLRGMLAIIAAIVFAIAWILNATGTATNAWFDVEDLLLIGLALLALHQAGYGTNRSWRR